MLRARMTMFLWTSERQVPSSERKSHRFMLTHLKGAFLSTREGTRYFFKDQLIKWIEAGGSWDKPYESTQEEQADFEAHLAMLQKSKKNKPASMKRVKGEKNPDGEEWHDG